MVTMSAAVPMPVHDMLLRLLLLSPNWLHLRRRLAALRHHVKWKSVLWHNLSQRNCLGATSAEDKCALCKVEVYMQVDREKKMKHEKAVKLRRTEKVRVRERDRLSERVTERTEE